MQMQKAEVKSKSDIVGVAEYPIYDNVDEAVSDKGEQAILSLVNAQVRTNEMNSIRNKAVERPTKKKLLRAARASISPAEFTNIVTNDELNREQKADLIDELVAQKAKELLETGEFVD